MTSYLEEKTEATVSLTKHLELSRAQRTQHTDLSTPCVPSSQGSARTALLKHLGLNDDVPTVFRSRVHLCHLCENGSNSPHPCGNPLHSYWGTNLENCEDRSKTPKLRSTTPPTYDGSRGPLPQEHLGVLGLVKRYGKSRPTLFKRRDLLVKHGLVSVSRVGNRVWYSPQEVLQFDKVDFWSELGFSFNDLDAFLSQRDAPSKPEAFVAAQEVNQLLLELLREYNFKAEQLLTAHGVK